MIDSRVVVKQSKVAMVCLKCCLVAFFVLSSLVALPRNYIFRQVGLHQNLSQVSVSTIVEDSLHRIWFGTHNGLNCWDGERMKVFYCDQRNPTTLIDPAVTDLEINGNDLWSLTKVGVSKMDLITNDIQRYYFDQCSAIGVFRGEFIVANGDDIFRYDEASQEFALMSIDTPQGISISHLYTDSRSELYIGCTDGSVFKYNRTGIMLYDKSMGNEVTAFLRDSRGCMWIGSWEGGLIRFVNGVRTEIMGHDVSVRVVVEDNRGSVWVGTFDGIYQFDVASGVCLAHYNHRHGDDNSLCNSSVHDLLIDSKETMWIGTYFGGVSYIHLDEESYMVYDRSAEDGLSSNIVGHIIEDENNPQNLWIATEGGGLNYLDRATGKFTHYDKGLPEANLRYLYQYSPSELLISTHNGGLKLYNFKANTSKRLGTTKYPEQILPFDGGYLVSTRDQGLQLFNVETGQSERYPHSKGYQERIGDIVIPILYDNHGILWIGTENRGLFAYDVESDMLKNYRFDINNPRSMTNGYLKVIVEDTSNRLWVASDGGGLSIYNRKTDDFTTYTAQNSELPSNVVNAIKQSHFGNMWISTGDGATRFDINNNRFYNYNISSGLPITELSYNSLYVAKTGEVFIGGVDGMISFIEGDLTNPDIPQTPILTELYLNNEPVTSATHPEVCDVDISSAEDIVLTSEYNSFEIYYSCCEYKLPKNKYQYRLDGYDEEWVDADYNTSALYSNLRPGTYIFRVRSVDTSHTYISDERVLQVQIKPPFYRSWYAYLFYLVVTLLTILLIAVLFIKNRVSGNKLELELADKQRIEVLNRAKSRFFTEISSEYLTPLTIIIGLIEDIFSSQLLSAEVRRRLTNVYKNSLRLKKLAGELVDFRKIEHDNFRLNYQETNIGDYINGIYQQFQEFAKRSKVKLNLDKPTDSIYLWIDPWQMEKVIFNTLSDVISSSMAGAEISIIIKSDLRGVAIEIASSAIDESIQVDRDSDMGVNLSKGIVDKHNGAFSSSENLSSCSIYLLRGTDHIDGEVASSEQDSDEREFKYNTDNYKLLDNEEATDNHMHLSDSAPTILIVEDDNQIKFMLVEALSKRYNLYFTRSDNSGIKLALSIHPDIILAAYRRSAISGVDLCEKIKRNIDTADIPLIIMATTINEEDHLLSLEAGAVDYIPKPFNLTYLKLKLENVLRDGVKSASGSALQGDNLPAIDRIFMDKLMAVIDEHLGNCEFNVDEFSSQMNMNRSQFYKRFKQITGRTPNDMIMERRLKRASEILSENPNSNISEVGLMVGFNSAVYFTQCFKRHFGVSPSKYGKRS